MIAGGWVEAQRFLATLGVPEHLGINFGDARYGPDRSVVARIGTPRQETPPDDDKQRRWWHSWGHYSPARWPGLLNRCPDGVEVGVRSLGFDRPTSAAGQ